jgi:hypothetical protein
MLFRDAVLGYESEFSSRNVLQADFARVLKRASADQSAANVPELEFNGMHKEYLPRFMSIL